MKPYFLYIAVPLLALVAGWASGPAGEFAKTTDPSAHHKNGREARGEGRPWAAEEFIHSFSAGGTSQPVPPADPLVTYLEKWTDAEIRAALDESLHDPELLLGHDNSAGVTHNLFRQLIARDFTAATIWFAALPQHQKTVLSSTLLWNWPADHAEEGMVFIRANRLLCSGKEQRVVNDCLAAAGTRGAGAFLSKLREVEGEGFEISHGLFYAVNSGVVPSFSLPPGFDFPTLFAAGGLEFRPEMYGSMTNSIFGQWQRQDRETAFRWVMENHGISTLALVSYGWGGDEDDKGVWFNGKMTAMPADQRADLLRAKLDTWSGEPSNAISTVAAARGTPIYQEVLNHGVQGLFHGNFRGCLPMIEGIDKPEERIRFLENLERIPTGNSNKWSEPGAEESFRARLRGWGADEARVNAIMNRLKQGGEGE